MLAVSHKVTFCAHSKHFERPSGLLRAEAKDAAKPGWEFIGETLHPVMLS